MPGAAIVGEVKCSFTMYDDIAKHGGKPVMWKTGHSLIKAKMKELQPEMEKLLKREKCLRGDDVCLSFPDLDRALEHCEDKMLSERTGGLMGRHSFSSQLATALGSDAAAKRLLSYADRLELLPKQYLVRQGDPSDALFIIESGRLSIMLELPGGRPLHFIGPAPQWGQERNQAMPTPNPQPGGRP